jgi:CIC family chloride channel protein
LISRRYQDASLFDLLARQDGMELPSMEEQREQIIIRVEDAMRKPEMAALQASDTLARALEIAETSPDAVLLVRFPTGRWASITKQELQADAAERPLETMLRELLSTSRLPVLHPDQRLDDVLRYIQGYDVLPVVSREGSRKLEGVISLPDVLGAYQKTS